MEAEHKKWIYLCVLGGILMIIGSVLGSAMIFALIFNYAQEQFGTGASAQVVAVIILILTYLALGGGITVIFGAWRVAKDHLRGGKLLIGIGAGMGLIGLIIFLAMSLMGGTIVGDLVGMVSGIVNGSYGILGVLLTIYARFKLKPK